MRAACGHIAGVSHSSSSIAPRAPPHTHTHARRHTQTHRHTLLVPAHPHVAEAWQGGALFARLPSHVLCRHFRQGGGGASMQHSFRPTPAVTNASLCCRHTVDYMDYFSFRSLESQFINTSSLMRQGVLRKGKATAGGSFTRPPARASTMLQASGHSDSLTFLTLYYCKGQHPANIRKAQASSTSR